MPRQPGTARTQTITISFDSPATARSRPPMSPTATGRDEYVRWRDVEIARLEALLSEQSIGQRGRPGEDAVAHLGPLMRILRDSSDRGEFIRKLFEEIMRESRLLDALVEVEGESSFSSVVELARQRRGAKALHAAINNALSTEEELKELLRKEWWVLGGRYIPPVNRERIPVFDELDLPLVRSDGAIHIVVLGAANVSDLIVSEKDGYRVGPAIHALVARAMSQLALAEKHADAIRAGLEIETRRAFATVVVGHPDFVVPKPPGDTVRDTIRTHNTYLAGIEVMTYTELVESAEKVLDLFQRTELDPHGGLGR